MGTVLLIIVIILIRVVAMTEAQTETVDTVPPVIDDCPSDIVRQIELGDPDPVIVWRVPLATDLGREVTVFESHSSGSSFPPGMTTVNYTFTDAASNSVSCTFVVTINTVDTTPPTFFGCPVVFQFEAELGMPGSFPTWLEPTATDLSGSVDVSASRPPGSFFPVGDTNVTYTFRDESDNTVQCRFIIRVTTIDTTPPTISGCPVVVLVEVEFGMNGSFATWMEPTATDLSGSVDVSATSTPGSFFPVGDTNVIYTFVDDSDNTKQCQFIVRVTTNISKCDATSCDNTTTNCVNTNGGFTCECHSGLVKDPVNPSTCISDEGPVVTMCPTSMNYVTCESEYEVTWTLPEVRGASDSNLVMNSSHSPGDLFKLGDTEVTYTFKDQLGNVALCSFQVSVRKQTENCGISSYIPYVVAIVSFLCGLLLTGILVVFWRKVCTKANQNNSQNPQNRNIHTSVVGGSRETELPSPTESTNLEAVHHSYDEPVTSNTAQVFMLRAQPSDVDHYDEVEETAISNN